MTVRFLGPDHGIRNIKDQITREIIAGFEKAGIVIAATRQEAVGRARDETGPSQGLTGSPFWKGLGST